MLEWDHLRVVLAVHRSGSMQAASQLLDVDRATVLRRLDALEARLGARLFERRRDGCVLTRAGLEIIATVEGIEQAMTALEHRVHGEDRRAEGVVTVTVPEFFAVKVLIPALPRLRRAHPGLTVEVRTGHGFLNLARGEADIALRNRRPDHNSLVSRRVGTVAIGLYASRAYLNARGTPTAGDYTGHDVILFDESLAGMPGYDWVEENTTRSTIAMRSNEILPLLAAARVGAGIAYLPAIAAFAEPDLVPVPPGIIGKPEIFLITHRDLRRRARVRVAFDFIVRLCTEQAAALAGTAVAEALAGSPPPPTVNATAPRPAAPSRARPGSSPA
jgi:DNA-binding transcriptional LysR family regulator